MSGTSWRFEIRSESTVDQPPESAFNEGAMWPVPAYLRLEVDHGGYRISVDVDRSTGVAVGLMVRVLAPLERKPRGETEVLRYLLRRKKLADDGALPFAGQPAPLSGRDVARLPLSRIVQAAQALVLTRAEALDRARETGEGVVWPTEEDLAAVRAPRGRPVRGRSTDFYREIAETYRKLKAQGKPATVEIARRKKVPQTTARQWVKRARDHGFLERPGGEQG